MHIAFRSLLAAWPLALTLAGCSPAASDDDDEDSSRDDDDDDDGVHVQCIAPSDVRCRDGAFQTLSMQDHLAPGLVTDTVVDGVHESLVDARAGGSMAANPDGWVYAKFDGDAFVKVDILDDDSMDSMDWDIAFRRFVIRLNSGTGGPSCVAAANFGEHAFTDTVDTTDANFQVENFMDDNCALIPDGSGLQTAAGTVLQSYWTYSDGGCLQMTNNLYVLRLANGESIKFQVYGYYDLDQQELCNTTGDVNVSSSANIRFRWQRL